MEKPAPYAKGVWHMEKVNFICQKMFDIWRKPVLYIKEFGIWKGPAPYAKHFSAYYILFGPAPKLRSTHKAHMTQPTPIGRIGATPAAAHRGSVRCRAHSQAA